MLSARTDRGAVRCERVDEDPDCEGLDIGEPCEIPSDVRVSQQISGGMVPQSHEHRQVVVDGRLALTDANLCLAQLRKLVTDSSLRSCGDPCRD